MPGPLKGIRVLDLGRFIACPFSGMLLADLGAEVIRVERPGGGQDRFIGFLSPAGYSYGFSNQNRNKLGITLSFERNERGKEILHQLIQKSDVVIQNFSPSAAEAIGITYEKLRAIKEDIIFAHVSAFGATGPYSHRLGFDQIGKAMSGSMATSGFPGNPPTREQPPHVDYLTASLTTVGVLSALLHRQATGEGQMVDTSLFQSAVTLMAPVIGEWEVGQVKRYQIGNRSYWQGPTDLFQAKDGRWVMLSILTDSIWRRFCRYINRDDLADDPRFASDLDRFEHRHILDPVVVEWVAGMTADEVIAAAEEIPIPCGICYEQEEVAADPQVKARQMLTDVAMPDGGTMPVTGPPVRLSATPTSIDRSFPTVGQHNREIYGDLLGFSDDDLSRLEEEGII